MGISYTSCITDVDECSVGEHSCPENADCVDTEGSYECVCRTPYTGTGRNCTGTLHRSMIHM